MATVDVVPAARIRARHIRLSAIAVGTAILLAGCGTAPGSAVRVAGTALPTSTVLDRATEVATASDPDGTATDPDLRAQVVRGQITAFVRHELTVQAAERLGVTVTEADVNGFIAEYDAYRLSSGAQPLATVMQVTDDMLADTCYDLLVMSKLGEQLPEDGADVTDVTVTIDVVPADNWTDAVAARVKYLADPDAMTADAAEALAANAGLPSGTESLLNQPYHAVFGIFSAADGEILLIPNGESSYLVTRLTDRTESPAKLTKATVSAAYQNAGFSGQMAVASLLLADTAESTSITVNPRFGRFDPRIVQVVAAS